MDFSKKLDQLHQHVSDAKSDADSAVNETRDKVQQRIDKAEADTHQAVTDAKGHADDAAASARNKWAQMKADVSAHMSETQRKLNKQGATIDANVARTEADLAESDAADAIDFAAWAIDNARIATLSAIAARVESVELATAARA
jgi:hypothetical protein